MTNHSTISDKETGVSPFNVINDLTPRSCKSKGSRERIISDVTYCRALKHSFDGGEPVEDWLIENDELDLMLYRRQETDRYYTID